MRNTADEDSLAEDVRRLKDLVTSLGRRRSLRDPIASAVEELRLTPPQVHTVAWLGRDGPLSMGEVAQRVGISEKTVTGIIDRLEKARLVLRERQDSDRRVVRCRLTKGGEKIYRQLDELTSQAMAQFLGMFEPADRKTLLELFEKLAKRLEAALGGPREDAS